MSWSASAIGKATPVAAKLAGELAKITYLSPEEAAVKDVAAACIAKALENTTDPAAVVEVSAFGSESTNADKTKSQSLKIEVKRIGAFVE